MSKVAMMVDDMFFASKIRGAAASTGCEVVSIKSVEQLETDPPSMVLLDLHSQKFDAVSIIEFIKSKPELKEIPVVAFLSHVQVDVKRRAEEAGCDYVIPRSLFTERLPQIVSGDLSSLKAKR
ncbi:MAG TPA: hypothetical protein VID27_13220 [Blastocatellia bacterium]|jgi:CheY-like chemotaxis protein